MSRYLIDQIERHPRVHVQPRTEVVGLVGQEILEGLELRENDSNETSRVPACGLFVFIGANPCTEWLNEQLAQDSHGFLLTGADVPIDLDEHVDQAPLVFETSRPGIFCVGDARSRSIKRVAAAVGEG
jgi:thioredoxin reductase (NADPH)